METKETTNPTSWREQYVASLRRSGINGNAFLVHQFAEISAVASLRRSGINGNLSTPFFLIRDIKSLLFGEVELMETQQSLSISNGTQVASLRRSGINGNLMVGKRSLFMPKQRRFSSEKWN